ncbi:hypothetical protein [Pseudoflavitalea rhizosphaerae]|uniref:hypothetical protein n=1 Tax=Pseudoflavitalea rhizosphaerae TaxID=1884793 RepID=UPI000F8DBE2E|nr:hypothetical protein [Pseudoflavitalea rhizosphaerae]
MEILLMRAALLLSLVLISQLAIAQNLTGIWRGKRTQGAQGCFPEYGLELHIYYSNEQLIMGNAYSYVSREQFTKTIFKGRYNAQTKRLVLIESSVLSYNVPPQCIPCIKTYQLSFAKQGADELLTGQWSGHEMGNNNACVPGNIDLHREAQPIFPVTIQQDDSLARLQQQLPLKQREKDLVQTLKVDTSLIRIDLYDNAEIDDDTVSIFLNGALLLHKKRLTDRPLTLHINAMPNTDYELMMYAENLGRIPPNTSLMIVTAGSKKYEIRISSNEMKSAVVRFRYDL